MKRFLLKKGRCSPFFHHFISMLPVIVTGFILILSLGTMNVCGAQVRLAWDPNSEEDLAGYKVYYGVSSGNYDGYMDVGNQVEAVVPSLEDGVTYYFAATAYDSAGNESWYSNEVIFVPQVSCAYSISPTGLSFGGSGGTGVVNVSSSSSCDWTAVSNTSWIVITSNSSGTGNGSVNFSVTANTGSASRTGTLTVAGNTFTVTQFGVPQYRLSVTTSGTGSGTVTANPSGPLINAGAVVTLTVTPDVSSTFTGWSSGVSGTSPTVSLTMNGDTTVTATFALRTFTITATAGPNGSISPQGAVTVNYGASQSFSVTPNAYYRVADLKVDGLSQGALTTHSYTHVISDHTIEVSFTPIIYTLTLKTEGTGTGTVTTNPSGPLINAGTVVTLTVTPDVSSTFSGWSGGVSGTSPAASLTMNGDTTVTATFILKTYTITAVAETNGSISPQGTVTVNYGANQSFAIAPDACYKVASLTVDGVSVGAVSSYTFNNVISDHSIQASFVLTPPEEATLVSPTGKVTDTTPTYVWNAVPGATKYYLFVNDATGSRIRTSFTATQTGCPSGTGTCSITPDTVLTLGTVKWWVQAWNSAGYGSWSDSIFFTLARR